MYSSYVMTVIPKVSVIELDTMWKILFSHFRSKDVFSEILQSLDTESAIFSFPDRQIILNFNNCNNHRSIQILVLLDNSKIWPPTRQAPISPFESTCIFSFMIRARPITQKSSQETLMRRSGGKVSLATLSASSASTRALPQMV